MQDKYAFKVGAISIGMVLCIAGLLIWKSGVFLKATGYELIGRFDNISGLLQGSEVRYRGYKVGKVFQIDPQESQILVHFWIKKDINIPQGTVARVVFDGLVGEKFLSLRPAPDTSAPRLKSGDMISGYASAGLADAIEVTVKNLEHTEAILGTFKTLFTDPKITHSLSTGILALEGALTDFGAFAGQMNDQKIFANLGKTTQNLDNLVLALHTIVKNVDSNVLNKQNVQELQEIIRNLREFSDQLKQNPDPNTKASEGINAASLLRAGAKLRLKPSVEMAYFPDSSHLAYSGNLDTKIGQTYIRTGFGDNYEKGRITAAQLGIMAGEWGGRVGAYYGRFGGGIDVKPTKETLLSVDIFEPNNLKYEVTGKMQLHKNMDTFIKYRSKSLENTPGSGEFGAGMTIHP